MASTNYFANFPTITYAGTVCRDITKRSKVIQNALNNPYLYQPATLWDGERADVVAKRAYGDYSFVWLVYLANLLIDPYYGWHLSVDQFTDHIVDKYGSLIDAQNRVRSWRPNWESVEATLSPSGFNVLDPTLQKYWQPVTDSTLTGVSYYTRSQDDWAIDTNQLLRLDFSSNGVFNFQSGDLLVFCLAGNMIGSGEATKVVPVANDGTDGSVYVKNPQGFTGRYLALTVNGSTSFQLGEAINLTSNGSLVTQGTVVVNSPILQVQVSGNIAYSTIDTATGTNSHYTTSVNGSLIRTSYIAGLVSNIGGPPTQANLYYDTSTVLINNISNLEITYWSPQYYYDYEAETNADNRNIRLINPSYAPIAYANLIKDLNS